MVFVLFQVKIWFQNRRMKWRNSKERELLSSGGSRDQTLPGKEKMAVDGGRLDLDEILADVTDHVDDTDDRSVSLHDSDEVMRLEPDSEEEIDVSH